MEGRIGGVKWHSVLDTMYVYFNYIYTIYQVLFYVFYHLTKNPMVWFVETCTCLTEAVDTQGQLLGHVCFMVTDERG